MLIHLEALVMLKLKTLYFLYYAAASSLLPFLVLYYQQLGLSGRQVSVLSTLLPLMTLIGVPLWSAGSDTTQRHNAFLPLAVVGALIATLFVPFTVSYVGLLAVVLMVSFFLAPIMPLTDHAVLASLGDQKRHYGNLRLWGAVGWGVTAPVTGLIVEQRGVQWAFFLAAALLCLLWGVTRESPKPDIERPSKGAGGAEQFVTSAWLGFLLTAFMGGIGLAVSSNFLYLHMADVGVRSELVGFALTIATVSELPLFFFSGRLLNRYAAPTLLTVALLVFSVRLLLYSFAFTPALILMVQILHGASFSLLWVAGVAHADTLAPTGLSATAQGLFTTVVMGWGGVVGALVGGALYDAVGAAAMFRWVAVSAFAACLGVMVWTTFQRRGAGKPQKEF